MPKTTIHDVAIAAGVSAATVDRALHGRGGVSQAALIKINEAVQKLGYGATTSHLDFQLRPKADLHFLIPKGAGGFVQAIKAALIASCGQVEDVDISIEFSEILMEPEVIVARLNDLRRKGQGAIGLFAMDTVSVRDAIDRCVSSGVPVLTMVSDVPAALRTTFVGIDNTAAGRTAARLMGKFLGSRRGKVAVIAGSMKVRDHMERFFAFREVLSRDYKSLTVLPVSETKSLDRYNMECVKSLMQTHDDLVGIYLVTGGITGVLSAIRENQTGEKPVFIAHDISPSSRRGLITGEIDAIINQSAEKIARNTVNNLLYDLFPERTLDTSIKGGIEIEIFVAENLP